MRTGFVHRQQVIGLIMHCIVLWNISPHRDNYTTRESCDSWYTTNRSSNVQSTEPSVVDKFVARIVIELSLALCYKIGYTTICKYLYIVCEVYVRTYFSYSIFINRPA